MSSINQVVLIGRLVRDPEVKTTPSGQSVCEFRLAVDRAGKKDGDDVLPGFFNVTVWGRQAEACGTYLRKGSQAGVSGQLRFREWEKDGQKRSAVEINAQAVQFLTPKSENDGGSTGAATARTTATVDDPFGGDDDIPF